MHRKTFTVTYHDQCFFFFFSDLLIQQPKAALYILKDNVTFPRGQGQESLPPHKGKHCFVQKPKLLLSFDKLSGTHLNINSFIKFQSQQAD